jgi:hypothetical protein
MVETLEPCVCIISEFGEEFSESSNDKDLRQELAKAYQQIYLVPDNDNSKTYFLAADVGLCFSTDGKIRSIVSATRGSGKEPKIDYGFTTIENVETALGAGKKTGALIYIDRTKISTETVVRQLGENRHD